MALLPAIFFGHGNPMNALLRSIRTEGWDAIGDKLPRAKVVLCISAHWNVTSTAVTVNTAPRAIHDFGGFPPERYEKKLLVPPVPLKSAERDPADRDPAFSTPRIVAVTLQREYAV